MDPNLSQLAHEAKDLLAPMLPYLLPAAAGAGKAALKRTGEKISEVTWKKAEALWDKLRPKIENRPAALEAAQDLANTPDDSDAQGAFSLQLKKLFADDADLAETVAQFFVDSSTHITASGERSVAANNVTNSVIVTGDRKEG
jgi:hypothetical protein